MQKKGENNKRSTKAYRKGWKIIQIVEKGIKIITKEESTLSLQKQ